MQGREKEAPKHFIDAIRIDPEKSLDAYYYLACIYAVRNEKEDSLKRLKKATNKGFNDWDSLKTDKDFDNIRNTAYYIERIDRTDSATKALRHEGENK